MQLTPRKEIKGRFPVMNKLMPWPFAALFGVAGVVGSMKTVWSAPRSSDAFRYLAYAVALALAIGAIVLLRIAFRGLRDFNARLQREENHPHEPWLWSHRPWDPEKSPALDAKGGAFRFARFPFLLGDEVSGTLTLPGSLANAGRLVLNLRHMEEEPVRSVSGGRNAMTVFCGFEHRLEVDGTGGGDMPVRFPLPADSTLTTAFGPFSKYWVLDVESVPAGERASFLLPVYPAR